MDDSGGKSYFDARLTAWGLAKADYDNDGDLDFCVLRILLPEPRNRIDDSTIRILPWIPSAVAVQIRRL